jgi:hypothetical protein
VAAGGAGWRQHLPSGFAAAAALGFLLPGLCFTFFCICVYHTWQAAQDGEDAVVVVVREVDLRMCEFKVR